MHSNINSKNLIIIPEIVKNCIANNGKHMLNSCVLVSGELNSIMKSLQILKMLKIVKYLKRDLKIFY